MPHVRNGKAAKLRRQEAVAARTEFYQTEEGLALRAVRAAARSRLTAGVIVIQPKGTQDENAS